MNYYMVPKPEQRRRQQLGQRWSASDTILLCIGVFIVVYFCLVAVGVCQ